MTTVTNHTAKTRLSKLIQQAERGEEVVIARGRTPVARLIAYQTEQQKCGFGSMRGAPRSVRSSGSHCRKRS